MMSLSNIYLTIDVFEGSIYWTTGLPWILHTALHHTMIIHSIKSTGRIQSQMLAPLIKLNFTASQNRLTVSAGPNSFMKKKNKSKMEKNQKR